MSGRILIRAALLVLMFLPPAAQPGHAQDRHAAGASPTWERSPSAVPGWTPQDSRTGYTCYGVSFFDNAIGIVVGDFGEVLCTTDGGEYWRERASGNVPIPQYSVTMVNARLVFATSQWEIARSSDAGYSWSRQFITVPGPLMAISFSDSANGWAVGSDGEIFRTTTSGSKWVLQSSGTRSDLHDVAATGPRSATAVGDAALLQTTDGGKTWVPYAGVTDSLRGVSFTDVNTGTIVGYDGTILRTSDGGNTWVPQAVDADIHLLAVSFSDANHGTAVGWSDASASRGIILRTTDGGAHWTEQLSGTRETLVDVHMTDEFTGTAVGLRGTILRTTTGGVTWIEEPKPFPTLFHLSQNYPNPVTSSTTIPFTLTTPEHVRLSVCDVLGREVALLVDGERMAGEQSVTFNASRLRAGIYFSVLRTGTGLETIKMLVLRQTAGF